MVRIIDMECNVPRQAQARPSLARPRLGAPRSGQRAQDGELAAFSAVAARGMKPTMAMDAFVDSSAPWGLSGQCRLASNDEIAVLLRTYPERFLGLARLSCLRHAWGA